MIVPVQTHGGLGDGSKSFSAQGGFAMITTMGTKNLRTRLGAKLFLGLALGGLLAAATVLYFSLSQGEARSPSASGQTTWTLQAPVYMGPEDPVVAEMPYDELSKNFIGVPSSGGKVIRAVYADNF
jgi:hypothetical protein